MNEELVKKLDNNLLFMVKMGMTDKTSTLSIDLTSKELEIIIDTLLIKDKVDNVFESYIQPYVDKKINEYKNKIVEMIDKENWDNRLDSLLLKLK